MPYVTRLSEALAIVACIDPDAYGTGVQSSHTIDMKNFRRVIFIVQTGDLGAAATVDFKVQESADGISWSDLSGKVITQLTQAGGGSDKQAVVEVAAEELGTEKRYLRGVLTIGTATSEASVIAIAATARYLPASDFDLASVSEIVV